MTSIQTVVSSDKLHFPFAYLYIRFFVHSFYSNFFVQYGSCMVRAHML